MGMQSNQIYKFRGLFFFLIVLGFHVILCRVPEKREKRGRRDSRGDERQGQGRKSKMNKTEKKKQKK